MTIGAMRNLHKVMKRLSRPAAVRAVETFVLPILLFGSETYPAMTQRETEFMTTSYMMVLRRATRMMLQVNQDDNTVINFSDAQVLRAAKRNPLAEVLKLRRDAFLQSMALDPLVQRLPPPSW